ncbi:30S ribosomal protein S15 [Candidatus Pacearchaeota archaeon]|nr:30S ribosomal protein S15 [Candidatus Pacearchaeota archaeon]
MEMQKYKNPSWNKIKYEEVEKLVIEMAKHGMSLEMIGLVLRDKYGIPTARVYGKKLGKILKEHGLEQKSDLAYVNKKLETLKKHLEKNKHDKKSKRKLAILTGRVRKLKRYYDKN